MAKVENYNISLNVGEDGETPITVPESVGLSRSDSSKDKTSADTYARETQGAYYKRYTTPGDVRDMYRGQVAPPWGIKDLFDGLLMGLKRGAEILIGGAVTFVVGAVNAAVAVIEGAINLVSGAVSNFVDLIFNHVDSEMKGLSQEQVNMMNDIMDAYEQAKGRIDEVQRIGIAWNDTPQFNIDEGDNNFWPVPMTRSVLTANREFGTGFYPAVRAVPDAVHNRSVRFNDPELAKSCGRFQLEEDGVWLIFYQIQGKPYDNNANLSSKDMGLVPVWVYAHKNILGSSNNDWMPIGALGDHMTCVNRITGERRNDVYVKGNIIAGGTGREFHPKETMQDWPTMWPTKAADNIWGVTISGIIPIVANVSGVAIDMSIAANYVFGGSMQTCMFAYKVNSTSLRDSISRLESQMSSIPNLIKQRNAMNEVSRALSAARMSKGIKSDLTTVSVKRLEVPSEYADLTTTLIEPPAPPTVRPTN